MQLPKPLAFQPFKRFFSRNYPDQFTATVYWTLDYIEFCERLTWLEDAIAVRPGIYTLHPAPKENQ